MTQNLTADLGHARSSSLHLLLNRRIAEAPRSKLVPAKRLRPVVLRMSENYSPPPPPVELTPDGWFYRRSASAIEGSTLAFAGQEGRGNKNDQGCTLGNVVPCCALCNYMNGKCTSRGASSASCSVAARGRSERCILHAERLPSDKDSLRSRNCQLSRRSGLFVS